MFGFAKIAGGGPASVEAMVRHLINMTLSRDMAAAARYYATGAAKDPLEELARAVADQEMTFSEAMDDLELNYLRSGGDIEKLDEFTDRTSNRLSKMAMRIQEGLYDQQHLAVLRPDIHPLVLQKLGIDPDEPLTLDQINALLGGRRADGELIEGKRYVSERRLPVDNRTRMRQWSTPIGSYDFCATPDKSVSIAWAFSNPVEQAQIYNAHLEAFREAMAYIASEIGQARKGDGGKDGFEPGHVAWLEFTHFTSRRVQIVTGEGRDATVEDAGIPGDMNLHTHGLIPNAVFCESGRVGSLDTKAIEGFLFEAGGFYQARLGTKLRAIGYEVHMDERTGSARMTAVPDNARDHFSKKTKQGEAIARKEVADAGLNWDDLSDGERITRVKEATQRFEYKKPDGEGKPSRGAKDDVADVENWRKQAGDIGWDLPLSFQFVGPQLPELTEEQRHRKAYEIGLPWLDQKLSHRSVIPHWDLRLASLRGLVETGCNGLQDIKGITSLMFREGVTQYGEQTSINYGQIEGKRYTSVTTALHERDEKEFVRLGIGAARDKSGAIPVGLLRHKMTDTGINFTAEQVRAATAIGCEGRFAVVVGVPGAGKTTLLTPIVAAWHEMGRDVWVSSLAWRQADDLLKAGIPQGKQKAFSVLLDGIADGSIKLTSNSVVAVDEWGQLGTRQGLELLRAREKYGFTLVSLGDDSQIGSIMAGAIFDLSRRVLGKDNIPEITVTQRQKTDREVEIAKLFRDGMAADALAMKREDATAELAYGGREGVIRRTAKAYAERLEQTGKAPTIGTPTNYDAHEIGVAVRGERRRMNLLQGDVMSLKATDGDRDYSLPLAVGDSLRLHKSTMADMGFRERRDGKRERQKRSIGRNGSVVEITGFMKGGVRLKNTADGREGSIKWADMPKHHGRTWLSYGYAWTNHVSQGYGGPGHIVSLPGGSGSVGGTAAYTALTRHEWWCMLITSKTAERIAVKESRPINDTHDITEDDEWANVAKNFVTKKKTDSALTMLENVRQVHRGAVKVFQSALRPDDPRQGGGPPHTGDLVLQMKFDRLLERVSQTISRVQQAFQHEGPSLSR